MYCAYNTKVDTLQNNAQKGSKVLLILFFLAIGVSIGLTYYHTIFREDYIIFTDPETVPEASDFLAYIVTEAASVFQK